MSKIINVLEIIFKPVEIISTAIQLTVAIVVDFIVDRV